MRHERPLSLALLKPPGECGVDIAVGEGQPLGNRLDFGGPSFGFFAASQALMRLIPGRIAGETRDVEGKRGFVLTLQTREQHIRREKATSNICTAQVLLAVMAAMYAVYHGPEGLRHIATRVHRMAAVLAAGLRSAGVEVVHGGFFDTVLARVPGRALDVVAAAREQGIALRLVDLDHVGISTSEVTTREHLAAVWRAFGFRMSSADAVDRVTPDALPAAMRPTSEFLTAPFFARYRSETAMLRYLRRLSDLDLALDRSMIPLGSCTMKLNATAEMEPISWPEFAELHPFAAREDAQGLLDVVSDLERWLAALTGYDAVSLQPNAGSQGEFAGLLAIRAYHRSRGESGRDVCLIPSSAHGTNAASAVMAGMRVVVVGCDRNGDVDLDDLRAKIAKHGAELAAIMITYPSTHGVFEAGIRDICDIVHAHGGVVSAVGVIVDRSGATKPDFSCPFVSLIAMNVATFPADKLPPDLAKMPVVKPGSK